MSPLFIAAPFTFIGIVEGAGDPVVDVDEDVVGGGWTLELLPRPALTLLTILAPNTCCDEPNPNPVPIIILPVRLLESPLPIIKSSFSFPFEEGIGTAATPDEVDGAGEVEAKDEANDNDDCEANDSGLLLLLLSLTPTPTSLTKLPTLPFNINVLTCGFNVSSDAPTTATPFAPPAIILEAPPVDWDWYAYTPRRSWTANS
jgi:hypothetical protein